MVCYRFYSFRLTSFQASATRALKKGTTLDSVIEMLKGVTPELSCPIVLFTYYNPILKRGVGNFMATIRQAGIHGKLSFWLFHIFYYHKWCLVLASSVYYKYDSHLVPKFCCSVNKIFVLHLLYVTGLVVPDLPLEETALLRSEAIMHNIELVHAHSHLFIHHLHKICFILHTSVAIWVLTKFLLEMGPIKSSAWAMPIPGLQKYTVAKHLMAFGSAQP